MNKLTLSLPFAVVNAKPSKPVSKQIERLGPFFLVKFLSLLMTLFCGVPVVVQVVS